MTLYYSTHTIKVHKCYLHGVHAVLLLHLLLIALQAISSHSLFNSLLSGILPQCLSFSLSQYLACTIFLASITTLSLHHIFSFPIGCFPPDWSHINCLGLYLPAFAVHVLNYIFQWATFLPIGETSTLYHPKVWLLYCIELMILPNSPDSLSFIHNLNIYATTSDKFVQRVTRLLFYRTNSQIHRVPLFN